MGIFQQFPYSNFHEMNMDEMIKIIKNMLEEWAQYHAEWDSWMAEINADWSNYQEVMNEAWQNMQDFINNYFDNLDVQEEINNKIVSMVRSGEFGTIIAPYIPPQVTAWLASHITQPEGVVIDTSLTVSGACADSKVTGDLIRYLNSVLEDTVEGLFDISGTRETESFTWIADSYVTEQGVITAYNGWHRTDYIDIGLASKVYLYASSSSPSQTYNCWYDVNKHFLGNFLCNSTNTEYTPPSGARYFILSTSNANTVTRGVNDYSIDTLIQKIGFNPESIETLNEISTYIEKRGLTWINGSYVDQVDGVIKYDDTWHRTDYIDIDNADIIYLFASSSSSTQRYNCWYNSNHAFISSFLCNNSITEYIPPQDAKYFILSTSKVNTVTQGFAKSSPEAIKENLGIGINKPAYEHRGTLSANSEFDTEIGIAPKIGFKLGLFATLSSAFNGVTIQFDAYSPNQIIVDSTNVTFKYRYNPEVVIPHNITIDGDVTINVLMDNASTISVTVASKGIQNTVSSTFTITAYETLKLINGNQNLTNLVLTIGCTSINHNIWLFGDSYIGMTNPARWAYYLNNGFTKNIMLCGSTGSGQAESNMWFNSFLEMGTPKKIIWCMGMNYGNDSNNAPNSGWLTQLQNVEGICAQNNIELILATIPTIPTKNHEQKNAYVRNSGYRYIDFAKAVGAQSDGTWYNGMLSSDEVHPTELGAKALYNVAIASAPEITYDYV